MIGPALLALNFGQIPASLLLLVSAGKLERKAWPYFVSGGLSLAALVALVMDSGSRTVLWSGLIGFADASALILGLTLAPLLCRSEDVARTSAGTFTISYVGAVLIAIISGALWDLSGIPGFAFVPLALCAATLATVSVVMGRKGELR